jgi:hypothetical protein
MSMGTFRKSKKKKTQWPESASELYQIYKKKFKYTFNIRSHFRSSHGFNVGVVDGTSPEEKVAVVVSRL